MKFFEDYIAAESAHREAYATSNTVTAFSLQNHLILDAKNAHSVSCTIMPKSSVDILLPLTNIDQTTIDLHFKLQEFSHLTCKIICTNCHSSKISVTVEIDGREARSDIRNFFYGQNDEQQELSVLQTHTTGNSFSSATSKTLLDDRAKSNFYCNITVPEWARNVEAHQKNENILLSETARAEAQPILNIFNNDVSCSHGAAVGTFDEEALFFMRARGIPLNTCKNLIAEGIFSTIVND